MTHTQNDPFGQPWGRRLVLAIAVALGVVVATVRTAAPVDAAPAWTIAEAEGPAAKTPATGSRSAADGPGAATNPPAKAPAPPAAGDAAGSASKDAGSEDADSDAGIESTVTIDSHGVGVIKNGKRVTVRGFGADREYDSFEDFMNKAPWLAGIVFLIVLTVFLMPLLIVALLVWYKIRKTRMQNETMLKLAERGVVPPAEAMQSLVQPAPPGAPVPPSAAPLYEQARQLRRRAAWSDLRKGVVMLAVGLGLSLWSILDDGSANSVGLVLLFVGIGYCVLWFFEDRNSVPAQRDAGAPPAGGA